ncbi:MAG: dihydrolipoamide acetyltransferase family protein [Burkholderiaceae bacterium]
MADRNDILMPKLGLTMTEGMLAEWAVAPGDTLKAGDLMFVVETDKVATEIMAPSDGRLIDILVAQGETVPVGAVVARWTGAGQPAGDNDAEPAPSGDATPAPTPAPESASATQPQPPQAQPQPPAGGRVVATPLARRLAHEAGLSLPSVAGTGPRGRIKAADVRQALAAGASPSVSSAAVAPSAGSGGAGAAVEGTRVPAGGLVQAMARRMVQAKQDVPHFYLSTEAEVSELLALRERMNSDPQAAKLTVNHFILAAVAHALAQCPWQNRIWADNGITAFDTLDVGMAVSTEKGLMAPVLRGLSGAGLDTIALRSRALIERVRNGQARHDDLTGGAITVSNAGMFNVTYMTPIINPPQSAILGVGSVRSVFRPDDAGQPVVRREMGLVLACDHRLHDGTSGLKFLNTVVDLLQDPYRLLRSLP